MREGDDCANLYIEPSSTLRAMGCIRFNAGGGYIIFLGKLAASNNGCIGHRRVQQRMIDHFSQGFKRRQGLHGTPFHLD